MKTFSAKPQEVERKWYVIDAADKVLGRVAVEAANILRGKNKTIFTPHVDCGDFVIVINADKVRFTGSKWQQKEYVSYSMYPGGQKKVKAHNLHENKPTKVVEAAVKGMLPKTKLGNAMIKKLFVYADDNHKHAAQKPETFNF